MFKAKFQAHRLVNIVFYIIVFVIGFYMGVIGRSLGIKDIFNKFFMIDNVSALEGSTNNYPGYYSPTPTFGDNGTYKNEQYIYNLFNFFVDYYDLPITFNQFNNVATMGYSNVSGTHIVWYFSSTPFSGTTSNFTYGPGIEIHYSSSSNPPYKWVVYVSSGNVSVSNRTYYGIYSNQSSFGSSTLNFGSYYDLSFNPYLFENIEDFKEVCIDPHKPFVVSTNTIVDDNYRQTDYFWFGGGLTNLKKSVIYSDNSITPFDDFNDIVLFNNKSTIINSSSIFLTSNTFDYSSIGNINYYGWSAIPFTFYFDKSYLDSFGNITNLPLPNALSSVLEAPFQTLYSVYPVYKFEDKFSIIIYDNNGQGVRHVDLSNSASDNLEICFYVNDIYSITNLETDNDGFYYGTIPTPDGDKTINVSSTNYDFFGSFNTNTYGLSSIISAPLIAIDRISSGTCQPQTIPLLNTTITLPCGDTLFWDREDVQEFKVFWNIFAGGIICYGIGLSLFRSIRNFKDPDDDRVEVIDL